MESSKTSVIIADGHQVYIEGLKTVLCREGGGRFEVIGEASTGHGIIKLVHESRADLLLLDMNLPDMDGLEVLQLLKQNDNPLKVITLSIYEESKIVKAAFKAGADAYVLKSSNIADLFEAIETVMKGETYLGLGLTLTNTLGQNARFMHEGKLSMSYDDRFIKKFNLSKREMEVFKLVAKALTNKEIANELYISDQTVSVHRKNIMRKLGVSSTAGLIKIAYESNLL